MKVSYQQIYATEKNCSKSKHKDAGCQRFEAKLVDDILEIQQVLQSKTYVSKPLRVFISDIGSKPRGFYAQHYYIRVIHHILVLTFQKVISYNFIYDSTDNQKNKDTHFVIKRLNKMMRKQLLQGGTTRRYDNDNIINHDSKNRLSRFTHNDKNNIGQKYNENHFFNFQLDKHNFFYRIYNKQLIGIITKHIKTIIKQLHNIDSDKRLSISNMISQIFGNVSLNELAQFDKHQLKVKHCMWYEDDFVLLSDDKKQLEIWQVQIQDFLSAQLSLKLKEVVKSKNVSQGNGFLGYIIRPHFNHVIRHILGNKLQILALLYKENNQKACNVLVIHIPKDASDNIDSIVESYMGCFKHSKSHKIIQQKFNQLKWLDLFFYQYQKLFRSKRHTKKFTQLRQQWYYFRFHYQLFVLIMQIGCYFIALGQGLYSFFSAMHSLAKHGNKSKENHGNDIKKIFLFKKSKFYWIEFYQKKLPIISKTLQQQFISYVVSTQQGLESNKLRKRKVSQIYISNNLNPKEAI